MTAPPPAPEKAPEPAPAPTKAPEAVPPAAPPPAPEPAPAPTKAPDTPAPPPELASAPEKPTNSLYDAPQKPVSIHEFTVKDTFGDPVPLDKYRGKVCVVVNTASHCPLTSTNYENLAKLKKEYKDQGKYIFL